MTKDLIQNWIKIENVDKQAPRWRDSIDSESLREFGHLKIACNIQTFISVEVLCRHLKTSYSS